MLITTANRYEKLFGHDLGCFSTASDIVLDCLDIGE
jgi:hypothetical protein